jgi:predicted regulator of Ras-like GTPase activity (Roadblock/LC7/MglB family)
MLRAMDADQALADLTEISSQVVQVAIVDRDGALLATTIPDAARARRFVAGIGKLLEEADALRQARGLSWLVQLEAATLDGSVFVVRRGDRLIAATTLPDPTVGLVFYDLKHCLRSIEESAEPGPDGLATDAAVGPEAPAGGAAPEAPAGGAAPKAPRQPRKKADASA